MIYGIGTDLVEITRFTRIMQNNNRFLQRYYTEREQQLIQNRERKERTAAMNFAGKEAVSKALGTGICRDVMLEEIEILRNINGAPYVVLYGRTKQYAQQKGITRIHISLSDTKQLASAYAVAEKE